MALNLSCNESNSCSDGKEMSFETGEEDPFCDFLISSNWKYLLETDDRSVCSKCNKSRKYFCYTCFLPMDSIKDFTPKVNLGLKVDVIKHPREIDGKSTAIHAAILAPDEVTIYTFPAIPNYTNSGKEVLVFPGKNSRGLSEVLENLPSSGVEGSSLERVVFIDSTWNQCRTILNDPRIKGLPCVVLEKRLSQFWRHQKGSPRTHLATIEAIHQFFLEYSALTSGSSSYDGHYDNLLFFFRFMYHKIHTLYEHDDLLSYKRPIEL